VHEVNPELLMVRMPAFGLDGPWRDRTGFAQTMESVTGMSWLTGFPDGPPVLVRGACDPLAGMHAVVAVLVGLAAGGGRLVESTMVEAALAAAAEPVIEYQTNGEIVSRTGSRGVYQCAGEDAWVAIEGDEDDEALARWCAERTPQEVVDALIAKGVPAEVVIAARDCVHNPQLRHRAMFEVEDHPVTGRHEVPTMPFRFTRVERWAPRPAPTLGQHNDEVLGEVASPDELAALRAAGVIGERLLN
jgi:crotonobetainyl-CoA:carnitine CoA-transferase CaiB-like acyl-CoA transferase